MYVEVIDMSTKICTSKTHVSATQHTLWSSTKSRSIFDLKVVFKRFRVVGARLAIGPCVLKRLFLSDENESSAAQSLFGTPKLAKS